MTSSRPLLVPHKRPLTLPGASGEVNRKPVPKILNPSAVAAEMRMKQAARQTLQSPNEDGENTELRETHSWEVDDNPPRIEVSFAMPPQPFLDPPTWEAMLKQARIKATAPRDDNADNGSRAQEIPRGLETPDQQRQRREREAEYGSMAIRGRSNVSGRGRRGKARGNAFRGER